jgi:hypothetical protein
MADNKRAQKRKTKDKKKENITKKTNTVRNRGRK